VGAAISAPKCSEPREASLCTSWVPRRLYGTQGAVSDLIRSAVGRAAGLVGNSGVACAKRTILLDKTRVTHDLFTFWMAVYIMRVFYDFSPLLCFSLHSTDDA